MGSPSCLRRGEPLSRADISTAASSTDASQHRLPRFNAWDLAQPCKSPVCCCLVWGQYIPNWERILPTHKSIVIIGISRQTEKQRDKEYTLHVPPTCMTVVCAQPGILWCHAAGVLFFHTCTKTVDHKMSPTNLPSNRNANASNGLVVLAQKKKLHEAPLPQVKHCQL